MESAIVPRRTQMTSVASVELIITPNKKTSDDTIKDSSSDEGVSVGDQELEIKQTPLLAIETGKYATLTPPPLPATCLSF